MTMSHSLMPAKVASGAVEVPGREGLLIHSMRRQRMRQQGRRTLASLEPITVEVEEAATGGSTPTPDEQALEKIYTVNHWRHSTNRSMRVNTRGREKWTTSHRDMIRARG